MRHLLHIFVILALVLAGISPACAFISGKSSFSIEICTADGIKVVNVPAKQSEDHKHEKKNDCGFCFAQTHLKFAKADAVAVSLAQNLAVAKTPLLCSEHIKRSELSVLFPRAPPVHA